MEQDTLVIHDIQDLVPYAVVMMVQNRFFNGGLYGEKARHRARTTNTRCRTLGRDSGRHNRLVPCRPGSL